MRCNELGQIRGGFDLTSGSADSYSLLYILPVHGSIAYIFGSGDGEESEEVTKVTGEGTPGLGVETWSLLSGAGLPPLLDQPM